MRTCKGLAGWSALTLAVTLVAVAAACGGDDDGGPGGDSPGPTDVTPTVDDGAAPSVTDEASDPLPGEGQAGGFMTVLVNNDGVASLDSSSSLIHSTVNSPYLSAIYDLLVYIDPVTGLVEPYLAESLVSNDDGSVWTMTLNPGIEFSDGTPFNAEAVHLELERVRQPDSGAAMQVAAEQVTTRVVDELTVEFIPDEPDLNYGHVIALNFTMIPSPAAVDNEDFAQNPVGAGPFLLESWIVGEHKRYVRNPNYWQDGLPYLDGFETVLVTGEQQQLNRMQAGDAHLIANLQASMFQAARDLGFETVTGPQLSGGFIYIFNHAEEPFDDVRARRAFQLAVDTELLHETLFPLGGTHAPVNHFSTDSPFYDPAHDFPAPDLDEAQRLIDELAAERGGPVAFDIVTRVGEPVAVAEFAQQQFTQLENVEVTITPLDGSDHFAAVRGGQYQVAYWSGWWSAPYPAMHEVYRSGETLNFSNYSNPEVDALFDAARDTQDLAEQAEAYSEIARIMNEDAVVIPYLVSEVGYIHPGVVGGLQGVHLGITPLWAHVHLTE